MADVPAAAFVLAMLVNGALLIHFISSSERWRALAEMRKEEIRNTEKRAAFYQTRYQETIAQMERKS